MSEMLYAEVTTTIWHEKSRSLNSGEVAKWLLAGAQRNRDPGGQQVRNDTHKHRETNRGHGRRAKDRNTRKPYWDTAQDQNDTKQVLYLIKGLLSIRWYDKTMCFMFVCCMQLNLIWYASQRMSALLVWYQWSNALVHNHTVSDQKPKKDKLTQRCHRKCQRDPLFKHDVTCQGRYLPRLQRPPAHPEMIHESDNLFKDFLKCNFVVLI